jgi:hypothetical protein
MMEFHSLKLLSADAWIEYARRIGIFRPDPQRVYSALTNESW